MTSYASAMVMKKPATVVQYQNHNGEIVRCSTKLAGPDRNIDPVRLAGLSWDGGGQLSFQDAIQRAVGRVVRSLQLECFVTFLDREECVCDFGLEAGTRRDRTHIRRADMCRIECGMRESEVRKYEDYRPGMVNTVIAEQLKAGGVDTEGTRAQAERWCAMLCVCICDGLRATTFKSRERATAIDAGRDWVRKPLSGSR